MKKSLIALAVAGAFAAPLAMADMKIGGEIDVNIENFNNGDKSWLQGNNTHTRWWMDSAEDIGGGASVLAHLEFDQGVNNNHDGIAANGGNGRGVANRDSFIGLKGEFGQVQFGTQEGVFEAVGYSIDPFHGAAGNGGNIVNILGTTGIPGFNDLCNGNNLGCRRLDQTLTYASPTMSGFSFQVDYTLTGSQPPTTGHESKYNEIQYGGFYSGKAGDTGFRVSLAGIKTKNAGILGAVAGDSETDDGLRIAGGVTFGDFSIDILHENLKWKDDVGAQEVKVNHTWIGGSYTLPSGKIAVGFTKAGKTQFNGSDIPNSDATHFAIGYYHNLSKNTAAYVIYSKLDNKDNAQYNMQDGSTSALGKDPSSIGVGLFYVF